MFKDRYVVAMSGIDVEVRVQMLCSILGTCVGLIALVDYSCYYV